MSVNMVATSNVSSEKGWSGSGGDLKNNQGAVSCGGGELWGRWVGEWNELERSLFWEVDTGKVKRSWGRLTLKLTSLELGRI